METNTSRIRLGVIGCGGMSATHAGGFDYLGEQLEITAVCDMVEERARQAAEQTGARLVVADYRELLDAVDAVLVVLPHDLHYEVGMTCLRAGKHVLMEKPLCNTERECFELIRTSEEVGKVLMTAYPVRFWPVVLKLKEAIDSGEYGECFQLSIWTEQYTRPEDGSWVLSEKRLGGGQFFSHGCHYVDIMMWLLGRPIRGTHLGTNLGTPWMEKEGTSNVTIEFESGALGYHFGTWGARGTRLGWSIHAHCTGGMLEINRAAESILYAHTQMKEEKSNLEIECSTRVLYEEKASKFTHYELEHFLACIRTGNRPITDGHSSLQGLRVIWRLYEAERNGIVADLQGLGLDEDWQSVQPGRA